MRALGFGMLRRNQSDEFLYTFEIPGNYKRLIIDGSLEYRLVLKLEPRTLVLAGMWRAEAKSAIV
jgi:hypothetical protein